MTEIQRGAEEEFVGEVGEGSGEGLSGGEGAGGTDADESYTQGGARGRDAERGEYYEPESSRDGD